MTASAHSLRNLAVIREAKNKPCAACGGQWPYFVMDFDHRDPAKKSFQIGTKGRNVSLKRLHAEMAKCDVLCANCHRIRHHMKGF